MPKFRIDNLCSQEWEGMQPVDQGRFCSSCQKAVVDFTQMSDEEIVHWMSSRSDSVCGRFLAGQLNRELGSPSAFARGGGWPAFWRYILAGLLLSSEVASAGSSSDRALIQAAASAGTRSGPADRRGFPSPIISPPDTLRGLVLDSVSGSPLVGASIVIDRNHAYVSDNKGQFAIPRSRLGHQSTIKISYVGYETVTIDIHSWKDDQVKVIPIQGAKETLGEVVVVGSCSRPKKSIPILKDTLAGVGLARKALSVYPNPVVRGASVTLSIRLDQQGAYTAQLFTLAGVLVETMPVDGKDVLMDIPSTLVPGVYFVRLSHPMMKKVYTQQVVVYP